MKKVAVVFVLLMTATAVFAQEPVIETVTINPDSASVALGGLYSFAATVTDTADAVVDTTVVWSTEGDVGTIDASGLFTSTAAGNGTIIAAVGDIADTAYIEVIDYSPPAPVIEAVVITPDSSTVAPGDSIQFAAVVTDTTDTVVDADVVWTVTDTTVGMIDQNGMFEALIGGETSVIASVDDIADTAYVVVQDSLLVLPVASVKIFPGSHCIVLGDSVQFLAEVKDSTGADLDAEVTWSVSDTLIGSIDSEGLFMSLAVGQTDVIAMADGVADTVQVTVQEEPEPLPEGTNTVTVQRVKKDGKITRFGSYIFEGDTLTIGGIPSPLNFMNGAKIHFPEGSLHEDITLTFKLPAFGHYHGNNVDFGDSIVTAVTFEVSVDGEPVHPYAFDVPLEVTIPFKRGLLANRGIEPEDLGMYYVSEDGGLIAEGITNIAVDYESNTITGIVEHFSDVALAPKQGEGGDGVNDDVVTVYPNKQRVAIGDTIQFHAQVMDSTGVVEDPEITWAVEDTLVGNIDETGRFTALSLGETEVFAIAGADTGSAEVEVVEYVVYDPGVNTVNIKRQHPDGKITQFGAVFAEGDTVTIAGIPHPLNFMNGTKLVFAEDTLNEDITLTFRIPEFGHYLEEQVTFGDTIVTAVTFEVSVDGEPVHPYYFNTPLEVSLPYKHGLLDNLGITPEDLGMYFVSENGDLIEEGITNIVVDYESNTITGIVEHFSDIAIAPKTSVPTGVGGADVPESYVLNANYPNPFNPSTTISFAIPEGSRIRLTIHNALGQQVRTLVNDVMSAGQHSVVWDGRDNTGSQVANGVYIYRLDTGGISKSRKMLLMK